MHNKTYIFTFLLLSAIPGYSSELTTIPEKVSLETIREQVARNEELINPIKMSYTVKKSRKGERQLPVGGGGKRARGRTFSHVDYIWAHDGEKHFARTDYFYGPNEPASSDVYVFDNDITTRGKMPDLMEGTINNFDRFDWYNVMVAKLGLRPFEGLHKLSEILVPEYASLHDEIQMLNGHQTYVVDAKRPTYPHYFARIWIDTQRRMPLQIWYYFEKHPARGDEKSISQINNIELHQLPNRAWIPVKGLRTLIHSNYISYEYISVDINSITTRSKDIPQALFELYFPDGARIHNVLTGLISIKGKLPKTYEQIIKTGGSYIAGTVVDVNGTPIPETVVRPMAIQTQQNDGTSDYRLLHPEEMICSVTDSKGRFAVELDEKGLYEFNLYPKDFVETNVRNIPPGEHDLKVTLEKGGTISGRVVHFERGKKVPIANIEVTAEGERFFTLRTGRLKAITDSQGRFQIRYLSTHLPRRSDSQYHARPWQIKCGPASETILFEEGQSLKEVELVLKPNPSMAAPLIGKKLPGFEGIKINLNMDQIQDKMILLCFFDMNQRPARRCIEELGKQTEQFKQKGVVVIGILAAEVIPEDFNKWLKTSNIHFPIGIIEGQPSKIIFNWSIQSLPWLILTDKGHNVTEEGFSINELSERLKQIDGG